MTIVAATIVANSALQSAPVNNISTTAVNGVNDHMHGLTTNGADRHNDTHIDMSSYPETTAVSNTAGANLYQKIDMIVEAMGKIMDVRSVAIAGDWATKYNNRVAGALPDLAILSSQVYGNAYSTNVANSYVKRDGSGNSSFGTVIATTLQGSLATSFLTGTMLATQMPAMTGDVTAAAGTHATTVATVGGVTAANVAAGANLANAAQAAAGNNLIVKRDATGGAGFQHALTTIATATNVTPLTSQVMAGQTAPAFAVLNAAGSGYLFYVDAAGNPIGPGGIAYPAATGVGASGTWPIGITGAAGSVAAGNITGTIAGTQIDGTIARTASVSPVGHVHGAGSELQISNTGIADFAVTGGSGAGSKLSLRTVVSANIADGAVVAQGTPNATVQVNPVSYYNNSGTLVTASGVSPAFTAPGIGLNQRVLVYGSSTGQVLLLAGTAVSGTPVDPVPPTGTKPLASVLLSGSATPVITQSMITQLPVYGGWIYGAVGSGSGAAATLTYITVLNEVPNGLTASDTFVNVLGGGNATLGNVELLFKPKPTSATYAQLNNNVLAGGYVDTLISAGAGTGQLIWNLTASTGGVAVRTNNDQRYIDQSTSAAIRTTNSLTGQPAGTYDIIADFTGSAVGHDYFNTVLQLPATLVAGQSKIGQVPWDGAGFWTSGSTSGGDINYNIPTVNSSNFRPIRSAITAFAATGTPLPIAGTQTILPGGTIAHTNLPRAGMTMKGSMEAILSQNGTSTAGMSFYIYLGYTAVGPGATAAQYTLVNGPLYWSADVPVGATAQRAKQVRANGLPGGDLWWNLLYVSTGQTIPAINSIAADMEFTR